MSSVLDFIMRKKIAFLFLILAIFEIVSIYKKMKNSHKS